MKKMKLLPSAVLVANLLLCAVSCQAQIKSVTVDKVGELRNKKSKLLKRITIADNVSYSNGLYKNTYSGVQFIIQPSLIPCDTVKCYFLEITDTLTTTTKWSKGYVARNSELVAFGKTQVSSNYLPITSGIVTSDLFYEDRKKVVNQCLQVVLVK